MLVDAGISCPIEGMIARDIGVPLWIGIFGATVGCSCFDPRDGASMHTIPVSFEGKLEGRGEFRGCLGAA